jgi:hypothetical protein
VFGAAGRGQGGCSAFEVRGSSSPPAGDCAVSPQRVRAGLELGERVIFRRFQSEGTPSGSNIPAPSARVLSLQLGTHTGLHWRCGALSLPSPLCTPHPDPRHVAVRPALSSRRYGAMAYRHPARDGRCRTRRTHGVAQWVHAAAQSCDVALVSPLPMGSDRGWRGAGRAP